MATSAHGQQAPQLHQLELKENQLRALAQVLQTPLAAVPAGKGKGTTSASPCCLTVACLAKALLQKTPGAVLYLVGSTVAQVLGAQGNAFNSKDVDLVLVLGHKGPVAQQEDQASIKCSALLDPVVESLQTLAPNLPSALNRVRVIASNKGLIKIAEGSQSSHQNNNSGSIPIDLLVQGHDASFEYDEVGNSRRIRLAWGGDTLKTSCESEWPHDLIKAMQDARLLWFRTDMNQDGLYRALKAMLKATRDRLGDYHLIQPGVLQGFCGKLFDGVRQEQKQEQLLKPEQDKDNKTRGPYLNAAMKMVLSVLDGTYFDIFLQGDMKEKLKPHFDATYNLTNNLLKKTQLENGEVDWVEVNFDNTEKYFRSKKENQREISIDERKTLSPFRQDIVKKKFLAGNLNPIDFILQFQDHMMAFVDVLDEVNQKRVQDNTHALLGIFGKVYQYDADGIKCLIQSLFEKVSTDTFLQFLSNTSEVGPSFFSLILSCFSVSCVSKNQDLCAWLPLLGKLKNTPGFFENNEARQAIANFTQILGSDVLLQHLINNPHVLEKSFAIELLTKTRMADFKDDRFEVLCCLVDGIYNKHRSDRSTWVPWFGAFVKTVLDEQWKPTSPWDVFFDYMQKWVGCLKALGVDVQGCLALFNQDKNSEPVLDIFEQLETLFTDASFTIAAPNLPEWAKVFCCQDAGKNWVISDLVEAQFEISRVDAEVFVCTEKVRRETGVKGQTTWVVLGNKVHNFTYTLNEKKQLTAFTHHDNFEFQVEIGSNQTKQTKVKCGLSTFFSPTLTLERGNHFFPCLVVLIEVFQTLKTFGANVNGECLWPFTLNRMIAEHASSTNNGLYFGILPESKNNKFFGFLNPKAGGSPVALGWRHSIKNKKLIQTFGMFVRLDSGQYGSTVEEKLNGGCIRFGQQNQTLLVPHGFQGTTHADGSQSKIFLMFGTSPPHALKNTSALGNVNTNLAGFAHRPVTPNSQKQIYSPLILRRNSFLNSRLNTQLDTKLPPASMAVEGQCFFYDEEFVNSLWNAAYCFRLVAETGRPGLLTQGTVLAEGMFFSVHLGLMPFVVCWIDDTKYQLRAWDANNNEHARTYNRRSNEPHAVENNRDGNLIDALAKRAHQQFLPAIREQRNNALHFCFVLAGVCFMACVFVSVLEKMQGSRLGRSQV